MPPLVKLENVHKSFSTRTGPVKILNGLNLEVFAGEVVCLLGPSGSGKSTTLRTINALETIQEGNIFVDGLNYRQQMKSPHLVRRKTAMIFQRFELFPHLTALDNVALAMRVIHGKSRIEARKSALDYLGQVELEKHADKYASSLSGGQQQRVAIARALSLHPKLLLCDEPTSALDPELVSGIIDLLSKIAKQGMTMIIATHELSFARQVSNRCLFLDHGEIIEQNDTQSFFQNPRSERLRTFLTKIHSH